MAKKDKHYLIHDYNASNDPKLVSLRQAHGAEGYGIYWMLIEWLRQQKDGKIKTNDIGAFCYNSQVSETITEAVINSFDLFTEADGSFFCERLNRDTDAYNSMRQKKIEAGRLGGLAKAEQRSSNALANRKQNVAIRGEESRVDESKKESQDRVFSDDSDEMKFSHELYDRLKENNAKTKEPTWQLWAKEFDLIFRLDGHTKKEIADVICWTAQDDFWHKVILSPTKLRKQFARLFGAMTDDKNWHGQSDNNGNPKHRKGDPPNTMRNSTGELVSTCSM